MGGDTGQLTKEAIAARGPRMCLIAVYDGTRRIGLVVRREGAEGIVFNLRARRSGSLKDPQYTTLAKSYTLLYLLRIANWARGRQDSALRPLSLSIC